MWPVHPAVKLGRSPTIDAAGWVVCLGKKVGDEWFTHSKSRLIRTNNCNAIHFIDTVNFSMT
jgi:hypothetical protein